ncbi:MAG: hypothetical protein MJZ20_07030 [Bacteroidaceae bacterium]|nr:hypothetical protein [Bacteroidaceae bacterium]
MWKIESILKNKITLVDSEEKFKVGVAVEIPFPLLLEYYGEETLQKSFQTAFRFEGEEGLWEKWYRHFKESLGAMRGYLDGQFVNDIGEEGWDIKIPLSHNDFLVSYTMDYFDKDK